MKVILESRFDVIDFIMTTQCYSYDKDVEKFGFSVTEFSGNQHNEEWTWSRKKLSILGLAKLKEIAEDRCSPYVEIGYSIN